jgi:hypothetical protein
MVAPKRAVVGTRGPIVNIGQKMGWTVSAIAIIAVIVVGMETIGKELSISEMDWDSDGSTSIAEFFDTMGVWVNPTDVSGMQCRRVFWEKDGRTIKILCP